MLAEKYREVLPMKECATIIPADNITSFSFYATSVSALATAVLPISTPPNTLVSIENGSTKVILPPIPTETYTLLLSFIVVVLVGVFFMWAMKKVYEKKK